MESAMSPDDQSIIVAAYQQRQNGVSRLSSSFDDRRRLNFTEPHSLDPAHKFIDSEPRPWFYRRPLSDCLAPLRQRTK
jgi:hypothetical protein